MAYVVRTRVLAREDSRPMIRLVVSEPTRGGVSDPLGDNCSWSARSRASRGLKRFLRILQRHKWKRRRWLLVGAFINLLNLPQVALTTNRRGQP